MVLDQSGTVDSCAVRGHGIALNVPRAAGSAFPRARLVDASGRMLALSNPYVARARVIRVPAN